MATLSTILGILGFVSGLIGLLTGVIFYLHSRRVYRIQYDAVQQEIIRESLDLPSLRLMFGQKRIHSLRIADVAIINTGSEIIRRAEHSTTKPLVIDLPGTELYGAELVQASRDECSFDIERVSGSGYRVSFDFMDPKDGCVVRLFLGGGSPAKIDVRGTFQAAREITRHRPDAIGRYLRYFSWGLIGLFAAGTAAAVYAGFFAPGEASWRTPLAVTATVVAVTSLLSFNIVASKRVAGLVRTSLRITSEDKYSSIAFLRQRDRPALMTVGLSKTSHRHMAS